MGKIKSQQGVQTTGRLLVSNPSGKVIDVAQIGAIA